MRLTETFTARGHKNIRATHRTTLMITKDGELTKRGDCIVAVDSSKGLSEIDSKMNELIHRSDARIKLTLRTGGSFFEVTGMGDPGLTLGHETDMVVRRSGYVDDRTLMIRSDAAAIDMPRDFVELLQDERQTIVLRLIVETFCE